MEDREAHKARIRPRLEKLIAHVENNGQTREGRAYRWALAELCEFDNLEPYESLSQMVRFPVTIEEFVEGKKFLGAMDDFRIWPEWQGELRKMCPDVMCGEIPKHEIDLGGASGTGKTTIAWIVNGYQVYLLSCFDPPHSLFPSLTSLTPIVFTMMSLKPSITKKVIYEPFRAMMLGMPYVRKHLSWDKYKDSELVFDNGVHIVPGLAMDTSLQGQAVCGGILDEMAFMAVIEESKQVPGPRGQGGKFDQAELVHRAVVNRRNRSFTTRGLSVGTICVMSNTRYQNDFMDRRLAEVARRDDPNVYYRRLKRHHMSPKDVAAVRRRETIRVLVGSEDYPTRILGADDDDVPEGAQVEVVPVHYQSQFLDDPEGSLREVCGVSTGVIRPFIARRNKIADAFDRGKRLVPWVDSQDVDLSLRGLPEWVEENMPEPEDRGRHQLFIHIDLSKSKDRCGVAVALVRGFTYVSDPDNPKIKEEAPYFEVPVAVSIKPSGENQIDPFEIRTWLMQLGTRYGFQIGGVSYDGYQSQESVQRWRSAGTYATELSVDRTTEPYGYLRNCLYQDRADIVESPILREELVELEHNVEKDKVDHPPKGSKDIADSVAGATFNASQARGIRRAGGYVDEDGERVRVRPSGNSKERQRPGSAGKARSTGRRTRKMPLRERMRRIHSGEPDPWST